MPKEELSILRVAVPSPLRRYFDYLLPNNHTIELFQPGMRLRVPFGRTNTIGILVDRVSHSEIDPNRLKPVITSLDYSPLLSKEILELMQWAAAYYHHPPGEVFLSALPTNLRKGKTPNLKGNKRWYLTQAGKSVHPESLNRAPRQAVLLAYLQEFSTGVGAEQLTQDIPHWQAGMKKLLEKEWVTMEETSELVRKDVIEVESRPILNAAQTEAITQVISTLDRFQPFLLEGVTGSGKTEVYLNIIEQVLQKGHQALVLVPEIGLTPQIVNRFKQRFNVPVAVLHSGLNDQERLRAWLMVKEGQAPILIGTRSAVFTPFQHLGIIIVDEEHDVSFKQQEGFRYSARDVAVMRARQVNVPIVLGTATPSLECVHNVVQGRYQHLRLPERAGEALHPRIHILDLRNKTMQDGLSEQLIHAMQQHLLNEGQVLLFLNRRGFAPTLFCHACGWISRCSRCDAHMTYHQFDNRQRCHHCGAESPVVHICPKCKHEGLVMLGYGTERIEQVLKQRFPEWGIVRIDRDSTRRKGAMDSMLDSVIQGKNQILIGTQMLAKGHHFPNVTLVGILNTDQGLFSADFRAGERMAQLIVQVAGRAGREEKPGEVLIQTHYPDHPLLQLLIEQGYEKFAQAALEERRQAELPPFNYFALLRAEAMERDKPLAFLQHAKELALEYNAKNVSLLGPIPAPMEKRAGRFRMQLLLQAPQRPVLHNLLDQLLPQLETIKTARKVRWSLDVDPMEMY